LGRKSNICRKWVIACDILYRQFSKQGINESQTMPNIKSVKKDVIRSRQRHARNIAEKSRIKTFVKKTRAAIETGNTEQINTALFQTASVVDKAAKKGIIHKNVARRRKSRLMSHAAKALAGATASPSAA
jgi:small subunit ribosomal protein S20